MTVEDSADYPDLQPIQADIKTPFSDRNKYEFYRYRSKMDVFLSANEKLETCAATIKLNLGFFHSQGPSISMAHLLASVLPRGKSGAREHNFQEFIINHGGKITTRVEGNFTIFSFQVAHEYFHAAFQFFVELFNPSSIKEAAVLLAIEEARNALKVKAFYNAWRWRRLLAHLTNAKSAYQNFGSGEVATYNVPEITLRIRQAIALNFLLPNLSLAVVGKSIKELKEWITSHFSSLAISNTTRIPHKEYFYTPKELGKLIYMKTENVADMLFVVIFEGKWRTSAKSPILLLDHLLKSYHPGSFLEALQSEGLADFRSSECNMLDAHITQYILRLRLCEKGKKAPKKICQFFFAYCKYALTKVQSYHFDDEKRRAAIAFELESQNGASELSQRIVINDEVFGHDDALIGSSNLGTYSEKDIVYLLERCQPAYANVIFFTEALSEPVEREPKLGIEYNVFYLTTLGNLESTFKPLLPPPVLKCTSLAELKDLVTKKAEALELTTAELLDVTPVDLSSTARLFCDTCYGYGSPVVCATFDIYIAEEALTGHTRIVAHLLLEEYLLRKMNQLVYRLHMVNVTVKFAATPFGISVDLQGPAPALKPAATDIFAFLKACWASESFSAEEFLPLERDVTARLKAKRDGSLREHEEWLWKHMCYNQFLFANEVEQALQHFSVGDIIELLKAFKNIFIEALVTGWTSKEEAETLFTAAISPLVKDSNRSFKFMAQTLTTVSTPTMCLFKPPENSWDESSLVTIYFSFGPKQKEQPFAELLHSFTLLPFAEHFRKMDPPALAARSAVIEERGFVFFKLLVEHPTHLPTKTIADIIEFIVNHKKRIAKLTPNEFELLKKTTQQKYSNVFNNVYERHRFSLKDLRAHQKTEKPSNYIWRSLKAFTLHDFVQRFEQLIVTNAKILHIVILKKSLYDETNNNLASFYENPALKVVTSVYEFKSGCNTYPDYHSIHNMRKINNNG